MELQVNMHCEACAEQLKKKILKLRGIYNSCSTQLKLNLISHVNDLIYSSCSWQCPITLCLNNEVIIITVNILADSGAR